MARPPARRLPALLAALLTLAVVTTVAAGPTEPGATRGQVDCAGRTVDGQIVVVQQPDFPAPPPAPVPGRRGHLVDLAIEWGQGQQAWVTDGWSIARTDDAGCSWDVVVSLDETAATLAPQTAAIVGLATAQTGGRGALLYALVQDLSVPDTSARFSLLVTDDGGNTFQSRAETGPVNLGGDAAACGDDTPCDLIGTSTANTIYVRFGGPDRTVIYRSDDQGNTLRAQTATTGFGGGSVENGPELEPPTITDLAVDPDDVERLWATSEETGPAQSQDGGLTFVGYPAMERFQQPLQAIRHIDIARFPTNDDAIVVAVGRDASNVERVAYSATNGEAFVPAGREGSDMVDGQVSGMAVGAELTIVVGSSRGLFVKEQLGYGDHEMIAGGRHANLRRFRTTGSRAVVLESVLADVETFWALGADEIVQFDVSSLGRVKKDLGFRLPEIPDLLALPETTPGALTGPADVHLEVGEQRSLDYVFNMAAEPIDLDVFFLLDETGSMQDEFTALAFGVNRIARELHEQVDLAVGLGSYGNGFRYHRYREIGPYNAEFQRKLEAVRAGGDGEVAYTGLREMVVGQGLKRSQAGNGVEPGYDAKWRDGSLRIVIHATDEELKEEQDRGPTAEQAIAALQAANVKHIGLIANDVKNTNWPTYDWEPMYDLARQTGALAPPGGIDCDRDGIRDVEPGDPIACHISPLTTSSEVDAADAADLLPDLADVILAILREQTLSSTIEFSHTPATLVGGFRSTDGNGRVDFRQPVVKPARALAVCTQANAGLVEQVSLVASSNARVLGATRLTIACGRATTPALEQGRSPLAAVAPASPAAPPAPIQAPSVSQGAVQSSSFASSNSLVTQAGAAAAQQEQQQFQQAGIGRDRPDQEPGIAYEFSARREADPAPITLALGAAMAIGVGIARSRASRTQFVRRNVRW